MQKLIRLILLILAVVCGIRGHLLAGDHLSELNFFGRSIADGFRTLRVAYGGILGLETSVVGEHGLSFREVTDGRHLVKLVYRDDLETLLTCDLLKDDPEEMLQFLKHFLSRHTLHQSDLKQDTLVGHLERQGNFTWSRLDGEAASVSDEPEASDLLDIRRLTSQCREFYKVEKQRVKVEAIRSRSDESADVSGKHRQKREGELIYPGTKWCGKGSVEANYDDLGANRNTDRCCRSHDQCPYYISGLTTKYGYYNYRLTTLSHCDCDERFRTCLKFQNNPVAENMGDIFFNRLASKCFVFKPVRVCAKRYWGRCTEYKHEYQAEVHDALEY